MKLAGNGGADDLIARAAALVYEDEFGHMCKGIVGLDMENMLAADWTLMTELSVELAGMRIDMRNAQFSFLFLLAASKKLSRVTSSPLTSIFRKRQLDQSHARLAKPRIVAR